MRYRVNSPQVISETVRGETIIVNLASGHYFNLQGTAAEIWDALERHGGRAAIVRTLQEGYTGSDAGIEREVDAFLDELDAAGLIVAEEGDESVEESGAPIPADGARQPLAPPSLTTFTDMQDIILLDPVHEVDPRGWPHAPASA